MATEVVMPQMGFDMQEGKVVRWLKRVGDPIQQGEPIAEIETDKAVVEVEAFDSGVLAQVVVEEGVTVPVGEVIGMIGAEGEKVSAPAPKAATAKAGVATAPPTPTPAPTPVPQAQAPRTPQPVARPAGGRLRVSPVAQRIALEKGIDLAQITGTGPDGRIVKKDILAFADGKGAPAPAAVHAGIAVPAGGEPYPMEMSQMRQTIARRMAQAKSEIPHFYLTVEIDMERALSIRKQINADLGEENKASVTDLIVMAVSRGLAQHPEINRYWVNGQILQVPSVNVAIAIALDDGLIVPAIMDTDQKGLGAIARESKDLVARARSGQLQQVELSSGTVSVSNLGMYGMDRFEAIINPPQSSVIAVGQTRQKPVVRDGQIVIGQLLEMTGSFDHRIADGATAAVFLKKVKDLIENPARMLI